MSRLRLKAKARLQRPGWVRYKVSFRQKQNWQAEKVRSKKKGLLVSKTSIYAIANTKRIMLSRQQNAVLDLVFHWRGRTSSVSFTQMAEGLGDLRKLFFNIFFPDLPKKWQSQSRKPKS